MSARRVIGGSLVVLLLVGVSCQNSPQSAGGQFLSGKVTYQGKTLQYGVVTLLAENGKRSKAAIKTDGTYRMTRPAPGTYKDSVDTTTPPAAIGGGPSGAPPKKVTLPAGTEDPEKSGITKEVAEDTTTFDIVVPEKSASQGDKPSERKEESQKEQGKQNEGKKDNPPTEKKPN